MRTKTLLRSFVGAFASVMIAFVFAGCGVGLDDQKGPNPERARKNLELTKAYESIQGVYSAQLSTANGIQFPVNIILYPDTVQEPGLDEDYQPAKRVVLRGRLERDDLLGESDNLILIGNYDTSTGALTLAPDKEQPKVNCDAGARAPISIQGSIRGNQITADVSKDNRVWAALAGSLKSRDVKLGTGQDFNRLRETYSELVGTYGGQLKQKNSDGNEVSEEVQFLIYMVEIKQGETETGEVCFRPKLNTRFLRARQGDYDDVFGSDVRYYSENKEIQVVAGAFSLLAKVEVDAEKSNVEVKKDPSATIAGTIYSNGVTWGKIELVRKSKETSAPSEGEEAFERERRMKTFREVMGFYEGQIDPPNNAPGFPVDLNIYVVDVQQEQLGPNGEVRFLPELRGRYRRLDFNPGIGDRLLIIRYYVEGGIRRLSMYSAKDNSSGTGSGIFSATGVIDAQKKITATVSDNLGPVGTMTLGLRR